MSALMKPDDEQDGERKCQPVVEVCPAAVGCVQLFLGHACAGAVCSDVRCSVSVRDAESLMSAVSTVSGIHGHRICSQILP